MSALQFEWDERKNKANVRKHGISFEEASSVFKDENALQYDDPDHSKDEDRYILLGFSRKLRMLVVCHCFRETELVVRIISARRATKIEQSAYKEASR